VATLYALRKEITSIFEWFATQENSQKNVPTKVNRV
jgi:hypothetical protein